MRLIDADELITAFPCGESVRTESVRATINHMPTIEVSEDANINCYEVVRHEKGTSYEMDKSISQDTCLTIEQAIAIVSDLNSVKHSQIKYKYYWRMRTK